MTLLSCRGDSRGSALIGFALAAPLFVLFVVGGIELGRLGLAAYSTRDAVVTASRMFRLHPVPTDAAVKAAVKNRFLKSGSDVVLEPEITESTAVIGTHTVKKKTISLNVTHKLTMPFLAGKTVPLSYETTIATY